MISVGTLPDPRERAGLAVQGGRRVLATAFEPLVLPLCCPTQLGFSRVSHCLLFTLFISVNLCRSSVSTGGEAPHRSEVRTRLPRSQQSRHSVGSPYSPICGQILRSFCETLTPCSICLNLFGSFPLSFWWLAAGCSDGPTSRRAAPTGCSSACLTSTLMLLVGIPKLLLLTATAPLPQGQPLESSFFILP